MNRTIPATRIPVRAYAVAALSAVLLVSSLSLAPTAAHAARVNTVLENFEGASTSWVAAAGSKATPLVSGKDVKNGAKALAFTYDVGSASAVIVPVAEPVAAPFQGFRVMTVAYKGDGKYHTLYVNLEDSSAEVFTYRIENLTNTGWKTATVDLADPVQVEGGDGDGVFDGPITLSSVAVHKNGTQATTGKVVVDYVRLHGEGWTPPVAAKATFAPGDGQTNTISFKAPVAGDYRVEARDASGHTRLIDGTVKKVGTQTVVWDGKTADGVLFEGAVDLRIVFDLTPGGSVDADADAVTISKPAATRIVDGVTATTTAATFETGDAKWKSVSTAAVIGSSTDRNEGARALRLGYDLTAATASIVPAVTAKPVAANAFSTLKLDVKGDGTYNTLYTTVMDATGEVFYYWADNLDRAAWHTVSIDLAKPTTVGGGNADGVLDVPLSLTRFDVLRNLDAPVKGAALIDNVRFVGHGWTAATAVNPVGQKNLVPSAGQTADVTFRAGTVGDYRLELADATGLTRTFEGTTTAPGAVTSVFDGTADDGRPLGGTISASLSYDRVPDGRLGSAAVVTRTPYLTGVAARVKNPGNESIVGINGDLVYAVTAAESDERAKLMEDAHVHYTREEFGWEAVERSKGTFSWALMDRMVADANSRNIDVIGRLGYSSLWSSSAPAGTPDEGKSIYPPTHLADYISYVEATVTRYKDSVHTWEIWNEQNSSMFWAPTPDAKAYSTMLKAASAAIKKIDPTATVVSGGLVGFDYDYMEVLRHDGALKAIDGFGLHTFVTDAPESSHSNAWMDSAEAYLARYAPGTEIWITELSWSTCELNPVGAECLAETSEEQQAEYLTRSYLDAASRGVAAITWWNLVEWGDTNTTLDNYGLVDRAGRQKPAYAALAEIGRALDGQVVTGDASPTAGATTLVDDLASTSGWTLEEHGSGSSMKLTAGVFPYKGETATAARFTYNFSAASRGVYLKTSREIDGRPTAISARIFGDRTNSPIYLKFADASGETFSAQVGASTSAEPMLMTLSLDGGDVNWDSYGGDDDDIIDYPIRFTGVDVFRSPVSGLKAGTIYIDSISAHFGPITRGIVLADGTSTTHAIYSLSDTAATIGMPGATVTRAVDGVDVPLVVTDGAVTVDLSPKPVFLTSR
jgi:GH35 family endo-1,4-beta-xylanase